MKYIIPIILFSVFIQIDTFSQNIVSIANDKMNIIYTGINNPLTVAATGVKDKHLRIECKNLKIKKRGAGKYMVKASKPGIAEIIVFKKNRVLDTILYRIKRIPDPVATLSIKKKGPIGPEEFKAHKGLRCRLSNFDYDAKCAIVSFNLVYVPKDADPIEISNAGSSFSPKVLKLIQKADLGDCYYFKEIMVRCPGDNAMRKISNSTFRISGKMR